jgi:tetratricopeptide (TPR) repeat protein
MEAEITGEIATRMQIPLSGDERAHLAKRPTTNLEAYKLYLKAIHHANKWTPEGLQKGIAFFQQALETDPAYPIAYSGLGYVYMMSGFLGISSPRDAFPKAKSAALKAFEIEEDQPRAHLLLGITALAFDWDMAEAKRQLRIALRLAPNFAISRWAWGHWLLAMGRCEEAIGEMKQALRLDP